MSENIKELSDADFSSAIASGITLVDFWAPWCGPCQIMSPILDAISTKVDYASICKVNVDDHSQTAGEYGVQSIPTLIIFKDNQEVGRMIGAQSEDAVIAELAKHK